MTKEETKIRAPNGERCFVPHPVIVHLLVVVFGISAWIGVNGIYVQLPLLVISAPEGWNLAAYLVVAIQAANVGPALYTLARKLFRPNETICILTLLIAGTSSMFVLAFFYEKTFYFGKTEYSVTLFVCSFFAALVGCTSSVLFMPYLRCSNERFLISYFIGEGLSGVLPSVVALVQGVGGNNECVDYGNGTIVEIFPKPRFTPGNYFIFIFTVLLISSCTFVGLQRLLFVTKKNNSSPNDRCEIDDNDRSTIAKISNNDGITVVRKVYLYVVVGLVCLFGNGFLPGIQTYSCLPYGNVAFHLSVTLANIANPTACFVYMWINSGSFKILDALAFVGAATCSYVVYLAAMSPTPPMKNSLVGIILAIVGWIVVVGIISYLKLFITSMVRTKLGPGALMRVGIVMQLGSACGALISFGLINYTTVFSQQKSCSTL